jgi:aspartyl-tRNA(Asn)/glutamyl-tRNA(Gln) amidotransferase subunit A
VTKAAVERLSELGAVVEEVETVFETDPADLWIAEFYAGVGTRLRSVVENQRDLLDPSVAVVLEAALGQEMRAYYETVFARYALREEMRRFFERYDVLLSPVLPVSSLDAGLDMPAHLSDRNLVSWVFYTYPFNLTGQPAAAVCAGLDGDGMPVGLQVVGRSLGEADVVRVAAAVERVRPDVNLVPPFLRQNQSEVLQ